MDNVRHLAAGDPDTDLWGDGAGGHAHELPHDLDAERGALGGMLTNQAAIPHIAAAADAADYYAPKHETIWRAITEMHAAGEPVDAITVTARLAETGHLQRVGGPGYVHQLADAAPVALTAERHAEIVAERAQLRGYVRAGMRIIAAARSGADPDAIAADVRTELETAASGGPATPSHLTDALLDWSAFFKTDFGNVQLLPGRLLAPGQQITLIGDGKAGKSLFTQEWAWRMATGRPFLDDTPQAPISVLYVDAENGQEQVQERFRSFGAADGDMGLLSYASFPPIRPLDTPGGGQDLLVLAQAVEAQVVVLDTISRFISGPENEADTWLALYRCTLLPLKRAGIASIRLDHFGKDAARGGRGSSAKTQDVDHVWELSAQGGGTLALKRTHTRTGVGPDFHPIRREAQRDGDTWRPGGTRHVRIRHEEQMAGMAGIPGTPEYIAARLDEAGIPTSWGVPRVRERLPELGIQARKDKVEEAVRLRKRRAAEAKDNEGRIASPENSPGARYNETPPESGGGKAKTPGQTSPGEVGGRSPGAITAPPSPRPPSQEGGGGAGGGGNTDHDTPACTVCTRPIPPDWARRGYDTHLACDPTTGSHPPHPEEGTQP